MYLPGLQGWRLPAWKSSRVSASGAQNGCPSVYTKNKKFFRQIFFQIPLQI